MPQYVKHMYMLHALCWTKMAKTYESDMNSKKKRNRLWITIVVDEVVDNHL